MPRVINSCDSELTQDFAAMDMRWSDGFLCSLLSMLSYTLDTPLTISCMVYMVYTITNYLVLIF